MINILSIRCSLAFAPYIAESAAEFLNDGAMASRVVRQGGSGLIVRSDGAVALRHEHRQASLGREEVRHYSATVQFRNEFYDVLRMQDEVVLANIGDELLLSHPQSEMWLTMEAVSALLEAYACDSIAKADELLACLPEWLKVSTGGARLLLSDQRTGRWVLLGNDHICELERRLGLLRPPDGMVGRPTAPTIPMKGLTVHLQSGFKLARTLEEFANNGRATPFEEITPVYSLRVSGATEGIELRDSENRVALTAREAGKWVAIIRDELDRLNAQQVERGAIRTVFAGNEDGRWILQWGDEVFLPTTAQDRVLVGSGASLSGATGHPSVKRIGEFLLMLSPGNGACVALIDSESRHLHDLEPNAQASIHSRSEDSDHNSRRPGDGLAEHRTSSDHRGPRAGFQLLPFAEVPEAR